VVLGEFRPKINYASLFGKKSVFDGFFVCIIILIIYNI